MLPVRRTVEPYGLLRDEFERLFDDFLGNQLAPSLTRRALPSAVARRASFPAFNVWKTKRVILWKPSVWV